MIELDAKPDIPSLKQVLIIGTIIMILYNVASGLFSLQIPNYGDFSVYLGWGVLLIFRVLIVGIAVLISIEISQFILKVLKK